MRVTQSMISNQYNRNLNTAFSRFSNATRQATDYRSFYSAGEDPMGASKLFSYRQQISKNATYQSNVETVQSQLDTAEGSLSRINTMLSEISQSDCLKGITGTSSADDRQIIATKLFTMRETLITSANAQYGDDFMFGGSNTSEAPFTLDDNGSLLYRGVNVSTGYHAGYEGKGATCNISNSALNFGAANGTALNGYSLIINDDAISANSLDTTTKTITLNLDISGGATKANLLTELQAIDFTALGVDTSEFTMSGTTTDTITAKRMEIGGGINPIAEGTVIDLEALANESVNVDLGLGLTVSSSNSVNAQSAFDVAIPGISFLGYGVNEDGISNNLYVILGDIAKQLTSNDFSIDNIRPYLDAFATQSSEVLTTITEIGAKSNFLEYNLASLETQGDNLTDKCANVEYIDTIDATLSYETATYAYKAALSAGADLLQYSFLDFMK